MERPSQSFYTVAEGSIGRVSAFPVVAQWDSHPLAVGATDGTITSIDVGAGQVVDAGAILYSVNLRPVVVMEGRVPSFRDIFIGVEGEDVKQLQLFLAESKFFHAKSNGQFGPSSERAVMAWQKSMGVAQEGIVRAADVIFVPALPGRLILDESLTVGARSDPSVTSVWGLATEPRFSISLSSNENSVIPPEGAEIEIPTSAERWIGILGVPSVDADGRTSIPIVRADGTAVCGESCASVPVQIDGTIYNGEIVVTAPATGAIVPVAAIVTDADGSTIVRRRSGASINIVVMAVDGGRAVVNGLELGTEVRLFGDGIDAEPSVPKTGN